ncbi:methyltransferase domain-containing protein [Pseudanabaena sp. FACHB-1998]|uniref:methyltransferase domain-containing protein n=1 Tax=Pseudanabaena sp. FACHB-1998 TaxID=2692858 RepID=UPI0016816381|nr:methyltransferase domain-containing protein [Pseudanabaena sp. FACHB-1998]MBD2175441.1 methyltransferase domain-containing protein [Pseudanabaena sp. FACHB-1998]
MPSFKIRTDQDELMDDFSIQDERLTEALEQLRPINQLLGGYATTMAVIAPFLRSRPHQKTRILDLGTGIGDFPEYIVRWAAAQSPVLDVEIVAIDANPVTVDYARSTLQKRLPVELQSKITVEVADALALPYADDEFDLAIAAMFLHHFAHENAVQIVRSMQRVSKQGILVNDLHRHPLAYYGIYSLTRLLSAAPMVRHDGPLSVLRGFKFLELERIAQAAELQNFSLNWRYAFRWVLSTIEVNHD